MKKLTLFLLCILSYTLCIELTAQSIESTKDGRHYYIASPNGRYFTGTVEEGPACFYDAEADEHLASEDDSVAIYAITNDGVACGSHMGQPVVWVRGKEWKQLPPVTLKGNKPISGEVNGMSSDATKFVAMVKYQNGEKVDIRAIYYELTKFEDWDNEDAWSVKSLPIPTKADLIYNQSAQFIQICGMNYDGTRILGRYMLADGKRQVPFIWQKGADGEWSLNFVAERCLFVEDVVNGNITLPEREGLTGNDIIDYDVFRQSVENGIIYDLSPYSMFAWTGSGRYIPVSANVAKAGDVEGVYYAGVIDVDKDTLVILTAVPNAGSLSVNDKGEVMVYTPQLGTFRDTYVVSIDKPTECISLIDYTKQRTNGAIDLAQYMTYRRGGTDDKPEMIAAAGSAIWANEGDAFVTFNYDEWNETKFPHCYMVRFGASVDVENVEEHQQLSIYPNPTTGVFYFEKQLSNVAVYDITGSLVYSQSVAEVSINLSSLNVGTYILVATAENETIVTKVMIVR